jgi:hypothetical protein
MEGKSRLLLPKTVRALAGLLVLVTSLIRFLIAITIHRGAWVAGAELVATVAFGVGYTGDRRWGQRGLLALTLFNVIYFALRGLILGEVALAAYEGLVSLLILCALIGKPTLLRTASCLGFYSAIVAGSVGFLALLFHRHDPLQEVVQKTHSVPVYQSDYSYAVSFGQLPWRPMTADQTESLLGSQVEGADLRLVREDGTSFGLFFPLQFNNIRFTQELGSELKAEIENRWLTDLHAWEDVPYEDGFLLTAQGMVEQTPLTYAIFYKHFGNFGLYAVFWSEHRFAEQLIAEAKSFYEQVTAPPLKERLPTLSATQIYQLNSPAVVLVNVYDAEGELIGRGTGFNVASSGLIITNYHLLTQGHSIEVVFPQDGAYRDVLILGVSGSRADLALLMLQEMALPTVRAVQTVPVSPGDVVYVIGNPRGLVNSISEGIIGGIRKEANLLFYQITAPISRGSSGGPVFNEYGEVVGVASALIEGGQNLNFSIAIEELRQLFILPHPISLDELHSVLEENGQSD